MTSILIIIIFPDRKYCFCLKTVFNSLTFQKMKSIFTYLNLNAYEHLSAGSCGMKNSQKKCFRCFKVQTMRYIMVNNRKFVFHLNAQFPSRKCSILAAKTFAKKEKKSRKWRQFLLAKVSVKTLVFQCKCHSSHWVSVLFRYYDADFEHAKYRNHKS